MRSILAVSLIFAIQWNFIKSEGDCYNQKRELGECVPISRCNNFNQNLRPQRDDICGFSGWEPNVCCVKRVPGTLLPIPGSGACGLDTSDKIFGGTETKLDEFPWMALLQYKRHSDGRLRFGCGGALISSRYVLTAAHCIRSDHKIIFVRLGEWNLDTNPDCDSHDCADPVQDIPVAEIKRHENYNRNGHQHNDIALIRLGHEAELGYFVKPICLPSVSVLRMASSVEGKHFIVAGWGRTETREQSNKKLKVQVKGTNNEMCEEKYRTSARREIVSSQICAGGQRGKDSCQGDSGGPLIGSYNDGRGNNYLYVAGLVSFGPRQCGTEGWPGVYTRVGNYIDWITSNVKP